MKCVSPVAAWALLLCGCSAAPGVITSGGGATSPGGTTPTGGGGTGGRTTTTSTPPQPNFGFQPPPAPPDGGAATGAKNCGAKAFNLEKAPAQILIVLDRSGSMNEIVTGTVGSKWVNVTGALNETLTATNGTVLWGLKTFPAPTGCAVADGVEVPIAAMNATPIATAMMPIVPNGSPPTALAVTKAIEYLKGLGTNTPKYIVLATDGLPNC